MVGARESLGLSRRLWNLLDRSYSYLVYSQQLSLGRGFLGSFSHLSEFICGL